MDISDNIPYGLTVYVEKDSYEDAIFDNTMANIYSATYMGLYQILNGINPEQWNAHIVVKDYVSGEIISESYYPTVR